MDEPQDDFPDITARRIVSVSAPSIAGLVTLVNAQIAQIAAQVPPADTLAAIQSVRLAGAGAGGKWLATISWQYVDDQQTDRLASVVRVAGAETEGSNDAVLPAATLATAPEGADLGEVLQRAVNALTTATTTTLWDISSAGASDGHKFGALALCQITLLG